MRYVGILLVLASLPAFMAMLGMGANYRRYAFIALGALPILSSGMNVDASFYVLYAWPGHTKGIVLSLTDTLGMAIILHYAKVKFSPVFLGVWILYVLLHIPGVFVNGYSTASLSYLWNLVRGAVYFMACFVVLKKGGLQPLVMGLGLSVIANGFVTIQNVLLGQSQSAGLVGHRNFAGMINNLAVPILVIAVLTWKQARIPALALGVAAVASVLGGSRGAVILCAASLGITLLAVLLIKPNKKAMLVTALAVVGSVILVPVVSYKMAERFEESGGGFNLEVDNERLAFERASAMLNADYPLGVGLNQYAVQSNAGGYASRAGVGWATVSRTAIVHNSYILVRTEGGHVALAGLLILLGSLIGVSGYLMVKKQSNPGRLYAVAVLVSISVLAVHINYEWKVVSMNTIFALAFHSALTGFALFHSKATSPSKSKGNRAERVVRESHA